jgi:cold shock CspA family protein
MTDYSIKETAESQTELHGVIKFFDLKKNFGFIGAKEGDLFIMPNGIGGDIHLSMTTITNSGLDEPPEEAAEISFKVRLNRDDENSAFASWIKLISPATKHDDTILSKPTSGVNTNERKSYPAHSSETAPRDLKEIYTSSLRPNEIIQRVLTLVRDELKIDVKRIIYNKYGNDWHKKLTKIRQTKRPGRTYSLGNILKNIDYWDSQAILTTIVAVDKIDDQIFSRLLHGNRGLGYVQNLCTFRNNVAHEGNVTHGDALFVIENAFRLLETAQKADASDLLKKVKVKFSKNIEKDDKTSTNADSANEPNFDADPAQESEAAGETCWHAGTELTRVFIGTTQGPAELLSLETPPEISQSLMRVNNTPTMASNSADYDAFVTAATGVIASRFGKGPYRANISTDIQDGDSWQLGMFAAHCLHSHGKLANEEDKAGSAVWVTGKISTASGLPVKSVKQIPLKVQRSKDLFTGILGRGVDLTIVIPDANASRLREIKAQLSDIAYEGQTPRIVAAKNCAQMCQDALNIRIEPAPDSQWTSSPSSSHSQDEPKPRSPLWSVAGLAVAGLAVFVLYSVMQTSSPPQTPPTVDLGIQWDKFD